MDINWAVLSANLRYWIDHWVIQRFGNGFPYGTLLINLSGSFLLGLILPQLLKHTHIDPRLQLLISVGF